MTLALGTARLLLAVTFAAGLPAPLLAEVVIAVAGPLTGRYAPYGAAMRAGADLAIEDLNRHGGVAGERVTLKIADDGCDRDTAVAAARRLVDDGVRLVVGHHCESSTTSAGAIYAAAGIIQIVPAISVEAPSNARAGPNVFRLSARAPDQDEVAARVIAARYAGKRVAVLHDRTRYGLAHAGSVKQALASSAASGAVLEVLFAPLIAGEKDYGAVVAKVKEAGADIVYFGGFPTEAALLVRQMRGAGVEAVLMGPDTLVTREFWDLAGVAGEGTLVTHVHNPAQGDGAPEITSRLRRGTVQPGSAALRSYAAVMLWARAARAAGTTRPSEVAKSLISQAHQTVLGPVTFDDKGDGDLKSFAVFVWRGGALQPVE